MNRWTPPTRETHELEERTGKNAEDFLDEPRQHPTDWEGWDDEEDDEE